MLPSWHAPFGWVIRVMAAGRPSGAAGEEFVGLASGGLHWSFWGVMSLARVSGRRPHPGLARGVPLAAAVIGSTGHWSVQRGVAQLAEQRSPTPQVAGSIPVAPAVLRTDSRSLVVKRRRSATRT